MSALTRLFRFGAVDADQRLAAALAPRPAGDVEGYVQSSVIVRTADGWTRRLQAAWPASQAGRTLTWVAGAWSGDAWGARFQAIGTLLLMATITHLALTMVQGPRPGWFWLVIPGLAMAFGVLLLVASRSASAGASTFAEATVDKPADKSPPTY